MGSRRDEGKVWAEGALGHVHLELLSISAEASDALGLAAAQTPGQIYAVCHFQPTTQEVRVSSSVQLAICGG